ncbi:MAG TPA: hypothetical protein VGF45_05295 [Polyangia bacterium]
MNRAWVSRAALVVVLTVTATNLPAARAAPNECAARLAFIDQRLQHTAHRSRAWSWGWGLGLGALTVGNLALVPFVERENRVDYYVGAINAAAGILPLLILPLTAMEDARILRTKIDAGGACTTILPEAETMLARSAGSQADGRAWWNHVANIIVNGGTGLFLGLAYDHWMAGIVGGLGGIAIGEAMIYTQPVDSIEDVARYQRNEWRLAVIPTLAPDRVGLSLAFGF